MNGIEGTRVGLLTFSDATEVRVQLKDYKTSLDLINAIGYPYVPGKTNTHDALKVAHEQMLTTGNGMRTGAEKVNQSNISSWS